MNEYSRSKQCIPCRFLVASCTRALSITCAIHTPQRRGPHTYTCMHRKGEGHTRTHTAKERVTKAVQCRHTYTYVRARDTALYTKTSTSQGIQHAATKRTDMRKGLRVESLLSAPICNELSRRRRTNPANNKKKHQSISHQSFYLMPLSPFLQESHFLSFPPLFLKKYIFLSSLPFSATIANTTRT